MFASCCVDNLPSDAHEEIAKTEPRHFETSPSEQEACADEEKQAEACQEPLVMDETQTAQNEHEQPPNVQLTVEQTIKEEAQVVADTPATKDEPIVSVVDVIVEEQAKPAVSDEKAELARVTSKLSTVEVNLQPGTLGVKIDGAVVVEVTPLGQAAQAGVKKGYKVITFGGESVPEGATDTKLSDWLVEKLRSSRPVLVQFERPVLEATISDGTLGLKMKGRTVIGVTSGLQAATAGVKVGCNLLSFGAEIVPPGKTEAQLAEWLQQQLAAPRPIVMQFEQP